MNEIQAEENGYYFQGTYSSTNKKRVKAKARELRKEGNKAIVVLSGIGYYLLYWIESEANKEIERKKVLAQSIVSSQRRVEKLVSELEWERRTLDNLLSRR